MKFTKSWFELSAKKRNKKILHPASFPEKLAAEFISFFTKKNQWVLDPFLGTGSSLIAAKMLGRNGIGLELYSKYQQFAEERLNEIENENVDIIVKCADARNLANVIRETPIKEIDFCITSPPYWNQLNQSHRRQRKREECGLDTQYGNLPNDLGIIEDYYSFLRTQKLIFEEVFAVTKTGGYLVVITNNIYRERRIWPLAFDTFNCLSEKWTPKDEKIWCQNDRTLFPFGIYDAYVGNRSHHYCLVFRKEKILT